jgi:hypothetical protein
MTGRYVERAVDPLLAVADQVAVRVAAAMAVSAESKAVPSGGIRMPGKRL